jgi:hypothetical protein
MKIFVRYSNPSSFLISNKQKMETGTRERERETSFTEREKVFRRLTAARERAIEKKRDWWSD